MNKEQRTNREPRKKAAMSIKEKRAAKRQKREKHSLFEGDKSH